MPMPGDQHRSNDSITNPFEEKMPRISEYTAKELATLQSRLDKQLGPEYISSRPGAGGAKVYYIAAEKVINLANEVFGFNGWSSQIQNVQVDFVDENPQTGRISLGLSTIVRVTLKDGTSHEDIGYGAIENCKGKAPAFEKAKKEAVTDALKRALRNFGNVLGNCLYDKDYLSKITKVKAQPSKWDEENLHRHHDFMPLKQEQTAESVPDRNQLAPGNAVNPAFLSEFDDEFGMDVLDEMDINGAHPDEVLITAQNPPAPPQPVNGVVSAGSRQPDGTGQNKNPKQEEPPVGFITSRAAAALTEQPQPPSNLANLPRFNPNAESPSIRKTSGVNHSTSAPVTKTAVNGVHQTTPSNPAGQGTNFTSATKPPANNYSNPSDNQQRRIGAPPTGMASPHSNRSSYKPPTILAAGIKRPLTPTTTSTENSSISRPPLADVSNTTAQPAMIASDVGGEDSKRPRLAES